MYNSLAGAPTSVNEQLTKQKPSVAWPRFTGRSPCIQMVFGLSEVDKAEAAELPKLAPVSLFRIQAIAITLDRQLVAWLR